MYGMYYVLFKFFRLKMNPIPLTLLQHYIYYLPLTVFLLTGNFNYFTVRHFCLILIRFKNTTLISYLFITIFRFYELRKNWIEQILPREKVALFRKQICRLPKCRKLLTMSTLFGPILTAPPQGLGTQRRCLVKPRSVYLGSVTFG
jgi:hypothetical protein